MKALSQYFLIVALFMPSLCVAFGGDVGNGGDIVQCAKSPANPLEGYYSLDFLVQYQPAQLPVVATTLDTSLVRIENILRTKVPELLPSFVEFRRDLFNTSDPSRKNFWEKAVFGLVDIKDEELVSALPENCLNAGKVSVIQAVIRVAPAVSGRPVGDSLLKYMPEVVDKLTGDRSVQLSFLVVHEWLWEHSNNVGRNRRINYLLHSSAVDTMSSSDLKKYLLGLGFTIPSLQPPVWNPAVCEENPSARKQVLALMVEERKRFLKDTHAGIPYDPYDTHYVLGEGQVYARSRVCPKSAICTTGYTDRTAEFSKMMKVNGEISLKIAYGSFSLFTPAPNFQDFNFYLSCDTKDGPWRSELCQHPIEPPFSQYKDMQGRLEFKPTFGKNCMTFRNETVHEIDRRKSEIIEVVYFFPKLETPLPR